MPLDGTAFAEHAIPLALGIAEQCDALLQFVHVLVPAEVADPFELMYFPDAVIENYKKDKYSYLSGLTRQVASKAPVCASSAIIDGGDIGTTLHENFGSQVDLIVMATHGRGRFGRFWWGSVAYSLLQRTAVPVFLVSGSDESASFKPQAIDHVVLPIDGDLRSEKVVEPLLELNLFVNARHTLLHVTAPEPRLVVRGDALRKEWVPSYAREVAGMNYLARVAKPLTESGRPVRTRIVSSSQPVGQVAARHIRPNGRELIACTYRPGGLWKRLVGPSVPENLFRTVHRGPLMFVPS